MVEKREKRERERERGAEEEEFFFFHFPFFSLSFVGHSIKKLLQAQQAALETMPSDNEEQTVDAKTIAELTEQV